MFQIKHTWTKVTEVNRKYNFYMMISFIKEKSKQKHRGLCEKVTAPQT